MTSRITAMVLSSSICSSQICAVNGSCMGRPASSEVRMVSRFTGARRIDFIAERVRERVQNRAAAAADRRFADPRAPTGVSGSGMSSAPHCMSTGTSRIVGGLFW